MNELIMKCLIGAMILSGGVLIYYVVWAIFACAKAKRTDDVVQERIVMTPEILKLPAQSIYKPFNVKYFALNTFAAFLLIFCLSIVVLSRTHTSLPAVFVIAVLFGVCAMVISALIRYSIELQIDKDCLYIANAVGRYAFVKADVPSKNSGRGVVRLYLYNKPVDFYATTLDDVTLARGTQVEIVNVVKYNQVSVERIKF